MESACRTDNLNNLLRLEHVVLGVGLGIPHALVDLVHRQPCSAEPDVQISTLHSGSGGKKKQ